tara:strand:+ start:819 stop:1100 length:282 start_codon:yes stop_codon:yes gene_type:complete
MKKVISVLVETTLEPGNLQVVLDEKITFRTPFVTGIAVQAPINNETNGNGNGNNYQTPVVVKEFVPPEEEPPEEKLPTYIPPTQPSACDLGGG